MRAARHKKPRPPLESAVSRSVQEYLCYRTDVIVWRNNSIVARLKGRGGRMRPVRAGVKGQADFTGLVVGSGVRLEIEIKRPDDPQSKQSLEQRTFQARIEAAGAIYLLVRSVDELRTQLDAALKKPTRRHGVIACACCGEAVDEERSANAPPLCKQCAPTFTTSTGAAQCIHHEPGHRDRRIAAAFDRPADVEAMR